MIYYWAGFAGGVCMLCIVFVLAEAIEERRSKRERKAP